MQLYVVYPVLYLLLKRFSVWAVVVGTGLLSLITCLVIRGPIQESFAGYFFCWAIGVAVAEHESGRCRLPVKFFLLASPALLLLVIGCDFHLLTFSRPIVTNLLAIPFSLAVFMATKRPEHFAKLKFVGRFFAWLGIFSYSLYMIHEPLLTFLRSWFSGGVQSQQFWPVLASILACMAAAWLLFITVEKRTLYPKKAGSV